jgi:hypothetical protein
VVSPVVEAAFRLIRKPHFLASFSFRTARSCPN